MAKPSGRRTAQFKLPQGQPQPSVPSLENNFVAGLKTEYTGLNFPENACTATSNCTFNRIGNVTRRNGIDYEKGFSTFAISRTNSAISTFLWNNAGGDGNTVVQVVQVGGILYFYLASSASTNVAMSSTKLAATVTLSSFTPVGAPSPNTTECQFASGNGYLFVFHPNLEPFYCTYSAGTIIPFVINIKVRDFTGIVEPGVADNLRPGGLSNEHLYNLQNQGWNNTTSSGWNTNSSTVQNTNFGNQTYTVSAGIVGTSAGQMITFTGTTGSGAISGGGSLVSYSGTTMVINITTINPSSFAGFTTINFNINFAGTAGQLTTFHTAASVYPSNADVWWTFKDTTGVFNPTTTLANVTLGTGPAPKGYYILPAFSLQRGSYAGIGGLTDVITTIRPKTGAWFQGRVFYAGVDSSQAATGDEPFYSWTENIYFSQIVQNTTQFEKCYQTNDPTSETLFDLLPSDGGTINIQGCGSIYKLYPVQNGLLVFAANGIWFITGNQGIGFSATDFTVSKLSGEHSISGTSFVDVQGYPVFWNQDGIYLVAPGVSQTSGQRSLEVKNITLPTIKQFYQNIPIANKLFARGSYNHLTGVIQWVYKSTVETDISSRYTFDSVLNFLTYTEAFYNWTIAPGSTMLGITYVETTGSTPSIAPNPVFKYLTYTNNSALTFSEERDNISWQDWVSSGTPIDYTSFFETGYQLKGKGQRRFQPQYIYIFSEIPQYQYILQGVWDYAATTASNRFSTQQVVVVTKPTSYFKDIRKIRIRGNGYVLQYKLSSVTGKPFNISGWSVLDTIGID